MVLYSLGSAQTFVWVFPGGVTGFPDSSVGKESACNAGDPDSIPVSGRYPREGIGYPLQYTGFPASCTELPLTVYFTYGNLYVSMLFSQNIPPSPSPTVSRSLFFMSVSPLLPCM